MEYKPGMSFRAVTDFSQPKDIKVHITHVIPSSCYSNLTFVVYKMFGTHKRWWHERMCKTTEMDWYRERAELK